MALRGIGIRFQRGYRSVISRLFISFAVGTVDLGRVPLSPFRASKRMHMFKTNMRLSQDITYSETKPKRGERRGVSGHRSPMINELVL